MGGMTDVVVVVGLLRGLVRSDCRWSYLQGNGKTIKK
jgi:hypothetical protein